MSPDGRKIAYWRYADEVQTYQVSELVVMDVNGNNKRTLVDDLDREVEDIRWRTSSRRIYFTYSDQGEGKIAEVS